MNKVIICGNLGKDAEIRDGKGEWSPVNLSVATTHRAKVNGQYEDQTEWHRVTTFVKSDSQKQFYGSAMCKGAKILVEGRLQTRSYEKGGQTRYATEIIADRVDLVSGKQTSSGGSTSAGSTNRGEPTPYDPGAFAAPPSDDDIPF